MAGSHRAPHTPAAQRDRAQVWLDGPTRALADECAALLSLERGERVTRVGAVRIALARLRTEVTARRAQERKANGGERQ